VFIAEPTTRRFPAAEISISGSLVMNNMDLTVP
jgi:hypothetical protein